MGSKPDPSYIVTKTPDFDAMLRSQNATALEEFLEQPVTYIVEVITGALSEGPKAWMAAAGRIVQGTLKAKLFEQFARELNDLRAKGRIPEDFAKNKYGFQTWVELLSIIDSDVPDEDRLEALKAMFLAVNRINATDGERILGYQLFQIAKKLNSGELLLLKTCCQMQKNSEFRLSTVTHLGTWSQNVASRMGHGLGALVQYQQRTLVEHGLLSGYNPSSESVPEARVTDLGFRFCENIERYLSERSSN